MDSKAYSWRYVTVSGKLSDGPCELIGAELIPTALTTTTVIYNGTSTSGDPVVTLNRTTADNYSFQPRKPIYCAKGLYITIGTSGTAILVQWRETVGE